MIGRAKVDHRALEQSLQRWRLLAIALFVGLVVVSIALIGALRGDDVADVALDPAAGSTSVPVLPTAAPSTSVASTVPVVDTVCQPEDLAVELGESSIQGEEGFTAIRFTNVAKTRCEPPADVALRGYRTGPDGFETTNYEIARVPTTTGRAPLAGPLASGASAIWLLAYTAGLDLEDPPERTTGVELEWAGSVVYLDGVFELGLPGEVSFDGPFDAAADGVRSRRTFEPASIGGGAAVGVDSVISTGGLGSITIGLTLQEVADRTGQWVIEEEWEQASAECGSARVGGVPGASLYVIGPAGPLDTATVVGVSVVSADYVTPSGLRVGDPESAIFEVLDRNRFDSFVNEYTGGNVWVFRDSDGVRSVTFDIDPATQRIVSIGGGTNSYRAEGCA